MRASVWRFVYCTEPGSPTDSLVSLLHEVAARQPFGKRIEVVSCDGLSVDTLASGPLTVFGNRLPEGSAGGPLLTSGSGWALRDAPAVGVGDVLFVPYLRNPWARTRPTVAGFYLAADPNRLARRFRREYEGNYDRMFWPNWAYELFVADGDRVYGVWADTAWRFDPAAAVRMTTPDRPVYDDGSLRVFAYDGSFNPTTRDSVVAGLQRATRAFTRLTGAAAVHPEVRLYPNLERVGLRTGSMNPVLYEPADHVLHLVPGMLTAAGLADHNTVWASLANGGTRRQPTDPDAREVALRLRQMAAPGPSPALRQQIALGAQLARQPRVYGSGERDSPLLEDAARAYAAWQTRCPTATAPGLLRDYRSGRKGSTCEGTYPNSTPALLAPQNRELSTQRMAGMTFAHEGYRVHNGYGGEKIVPSLDSLATLNVNAIAIVPYSFMRDPNRVASLPISDDAGNENDWAVIRSVREAHRRGWTVMLKPQIWIGGGHWPGDVDFATTEEWDTFFARYTYWIMHYALLAERERVGVLCLGTELVQTTLKHPERWREVIRQVRTVFGGRLTYAANWGEEFEGLSFWEDLDVIGLNAYYPLSKDTDPTDEQLLAGARRYLTMAATTAERFGRPLWLTEVGFRSVTAPWANPHAEPNDRPSSETDQQRCYRALTVAAGEVPDLRGMFVWKWPSYLGRGSYRGERVGFTPGGKAAGVTLGDFYGRWAVVR